MNNACALISVRKIQHFFQLRKLSDFFKKDKKEMINFKNFILHNSSFILS
jgi:hypothetical protein